MKRKKSYKVLIGIILFIMWIILLSGIIHFPPFIWFLLVIITFVFYIGSTGPLFRGKRSPKDSIEEMEDYMERKAEEQLGKTENEESSEDQDEEEYEFDDDIKIIKE